MLVRWSQFLENNRLGSHLRLRWPQSPLPASRYTTLLCVIWWDCPSRICVIWGNGRQGAPTLTLDLVTGWTSVILTGFLSVRGNDQQCIPILALCQRSQRSRLANSAVLTLSGPSNRMASKVCQFRTTPAIRFNYRCWRCQVRLTWWNHQRFLVLKCRLTDSLVMVYLF